MILLFIGGLVVGALAGIFALGLPPGIARSAAHITTARWKPCGGGKTGGSK